MKRFDINRKHGTVFGDQIENPDRPRAYWQDGVYFDALGYPVDEPLPANASEPIPAAEPVAVVELKSPADIEAIEKLKGKSVTALRKLALTVHKASGVELPVMKGKGVVARLVAYIAENTD